MKLLSNETYELIYPFKDSKWGLDLVEFENQELINIYPTPLTLIYLQPLRSLNNARREYFKEKTIKGVRPVIFALGSNEYGDKFILDGHHKAYVYRSLGIKPNILFIKKNDAFMELSEDKKTEALNHILPNGKFSKDKSPRIAGVLKSQEVVTSYTGVTLHFCNCNTFFTAFLFEPSSKMALTY